MLPHGFLGILISALLIVGIGFLLNLVATKFNIKNGKYAVAYYAFLVLIASVHPLGLVLDFAFALILYFTGGEAARVAIIFFIITVILIGILSFIFSHAVLVFPITFWR